MLWRLADGKELARYPSPVDRVLCLAALPASGVVVAGGKDKRVVAVDVDTGATRMLGRHRNQVRGVAAFDDRHVVTGSYDGQVRIWDVESSSHRRVGIHNGWCLAVAAPRGGGVVATGSSDRRLRIWDPDGAPPDLDRKRSTRSLVVVDGIAYGGTNRAVHRVDTRTGTSLAPLIGHRGNVETMVATAYGVASGSGDKTIRRWDPALDECLVLRGHEAGVGALAVTPAGTEIVSVSHDRTWRRWDARTGEAGPVGQGTEPYTSALVLSPDGEFVVTATIEHTIEVWGRESGRQVARLPGHTGYVVSLLVPPGHGLLVSGSWDRTIRVWDVRTGDLHWTLRCEEWIVDLAMTTDGALAAAYCADGTILLIDIAHRSLRGTLDLGRPSYGRLVLGADDRTIFAISSYELQAWDLVSGDRLASFDADLPLREIALAGPDDVVVGTDLGTLVALRLERALPSAPIGRHTVVRGRAGGFR
ncbi:WD40 repeat domain-containing protein [Kribbella sp. NPDC050820]|uniref:WD40 repeat domain-containing protein n=1 Tax=Kribbella sp. NPDC050820 TaxID=3155408 RepID=UPI0033EEEBF7